MNYKIKIDPPQFKSFIFSLVAKAGFPVHMYNRYCQWWLENFGQCKGCSGEDGCARINQLLKLFNSAAYYIPKSFDDLIKTQKRVEEETKRILEKNMNGNEK